MQIQHDSLYLAGFTIVEQLAAEGHTAYFAGGCVRDWILGNRPRDLDVATSARPEEIQARFADTHPIGKSFGVIQVRMHDHRFEVATFRTEHGHSDGRRPDEVRFASDREDAQRRDFTINGLFYDPISDSCIDYVSGIADIEQRTVRAIGDPDLRFAEDYLRMLRAVRFAATLDFEIDSDTCAAIRRLAGQLTHISAERISGELHRILLESPRPGDGIRLLESAGLLPIILPEIHALIGQEQPPQFHPEGDVFTHTMMMLNRMEHPTLTLAYAVLLHDVGKPATATVTREPDGSDRIRFNQHAQVGAEMARDILGRLRIPNQHTDAITHCVHNHMRFMDVPHMRKATLRRMVGAKTFPVELELHRLDCLCSNGDLGNYHALLAFIEASRHEPALPERWIRGEDVMALGIPPGPELGRWLGVAYDAQLEGQAASRDDLLAWLEQHIAEATPSPSSQARSPDGGRS